MTGRTTVTSDAEGRRVVAKAAGSPSEATDLGREAEILEAARHPGVVEVIGLDGHGGLPVLLTAHVEGPTLAAIGALPLEEAAGVLAALASTVADLHEMGLVHGAVAPEHVLLGAGGRPVLCGFAYGGREGAAAPPPPAGIDGFVDPARVSGDRLAGTVDVFGLGALTRHLVPAPPAGHVLGRLADQATAPDTTARPSARALAAAIQREVPSARFPRALAPAPPARRAGASPDPLEAWRRQWAPTPGGGRRRPSVRLLATTSAAVVVVVGASLALAAHPRRPGTTSALPLVVDNAADTASPTGQASEARPDPTTTGGGPAPVTAAGRRDCPEVAALLQADVDGDGCADALRYADGVLAAGGSRWTVGQPGDQLVTGNWACQGSRTLALLRPTTGEVFRFDGWAATGRDISATAVARVDGGQALRAADLDHNGCHELVVERGTGPPEIVRVPPARP